MIRRNFASLISATSLVSLVACAAEPGDDPAGGGGGGKADGTTPLVTFADDWSETASGDLLAGSAVRIAYDLDRLTECRGSTNGSEVWGVTGYASFDGGEPAIFSVSRLDGGVVKPVVAEVDVPAAATSVELWFSISNRWGCISYDSNMGGNYRFAVERPGGAVLSFDADFSESQSDAIHAGDQLVVHYEPARLEQCAATRNGFPAWGITGYYQVDGGAVKTFSVARASGSPGSTLVAADPTISVPHGRDLAMWFQATSIYGCNAYDSNLSANYHFAIE
jgi:uncharacterized protein YraI